jgi:hypothetical protein
MSNIPTNKKLYSKIKIKAKKKFKVWPSAYASGWLVKEYKKQGGKYFNNYSYMKVSKTNKTGLSRWFAEEWIDVCKLPYIVPCGRKTYNRNYPYCRPRYKITSKSPNTAQTLSKLEIKSRCKQKRKNPSNKIRSKKHRHSSRKYRRSPKKYYRSPKKYYRSHKKYYRSPKKYCRSPKKYSSSPKKYHSSPKKYRRSPKKYHSSPKKYRSSPKKYRSSPKNIVARLKKYRRLPKNT